MCIELPCGYSSQTLTKIIAYCSFVVYACLLAGIAIFGVCSPDAQEQSNPAITSVVNDIFNETASAEEILLDATETTTTEETVDVNITLSEQHHNHNHDLIQLPEMSFPARTCFVIWIVLNFMGGLIFSIVLLQGAQEKNIRKVRLWFFVTVVGYLVWIPIYAYWVCYAVEPVNVLMTGFMAYMLGGFSLWVVSGFIEELRIESISHRVGYKDIQVPFFKI